jgi:inorganic pyrophosphatase
MKPDLFRWIGQTVSVQVDRPLGSAHPDHPEFIYALNYGFLPNTISGDGEAIDAYILGITEPVLTFTGVVIAVIIRGDDCEDKLVVAPPNTAFTDAQIPAAVAFQERGFKTSLQR